jgi:hypothetical protein
MRPTRRWRPSPWIAVALVLAVAYAFSDEEPPVQRPRAEGEQPNCWPLLTSFAQDLSYVRARGRRPVEAHAAQDHYDLARIACTAGRAEDAVAEIKAGMALVAPPQDAAEPTLIAAESIETAPDAPASR